MGRLEVPADCVDADPANQRHGKLKSGEHTGNSAHSVFFHLRVIQAVCQGYGKGVHGKSHAEQNAVNDKCKI